MFEKIAASTNGQLFGWCFIGLRIFLGLAFIYLALGWIDMDAANETITWSSVIWLLMLGLGGSLFLGLLVRPFSLAALIYLLINTVLSAQSGDIMMIIINIPLILLFGMYLAGGAGHSVGLDGIIYRNFRRPSQAVRFLFG